MNNIIRNIKENYKLVIGVLITGLLLGWLFFGSPSSTGSSTEVTLSQSEHDHEEEDPTVWTCSMHPQIRQEKPGDCPICGMDLIPLATMTSGDGTAYENEIMMTEEAASLANIQTTRVEHGTPEKTIYLQGKVKSDERNIAEITARFGGRIEKLFINFTGEHVDKNQKLATIYSPELVTAQRELLEAASLKESNPSLYNAARAKLKLWDLNDEQIASIEEQGEPKLYFDILAPISGTVMKRHVTHGDYVQTGQGLFRISNLSKVWVMFDAYETDLPWIKTGDRIEFTIHSLPGETYKTKVAYIDPFIDPQTRTAGIRAELNNPGLKLKPEMYAGGTLYSEIAANTDQLLIPKSSILWTGKRSVVFVRVPNEEAPTFRYREIVLGPEAGDSYVVAEGLDEGDEIATNGVFKIDAAAQLEGKPSMMNPEGGKISTGHDHGAMDMSDDEMETSGAGQSEMEEIAAPSEFREQLTAVYRTYIEMKDAFVASDAETVSEYAGEVIEELDQVDMGLLEGEAHMVWMDQLQVLEENLKAIRESEDLEAQRLNFSSFNLEFYDVVKTFGLSDVKAYYQYCPMAIQDKGAYWFSNEPEIRNPYFGDALLACGENRDTVGSE